MRRARSTSYRVSVRVILAMIALTIAHISSSDTSDMAIYGNCVVDSLFDPIREETSYRLACGKWTNRNERGRVILTLRERDSVVSTSFRVDRFQHSFKSIRVMFHVDDGEFKRPRNFTYNQRSRVATSYDVDTFNWLLRELRYGRTLHIELQSVAGSASISLDGSDAAIMDFTGRIDHVTSRRN